MQKKIQSSIIILKTGLQSVFFFLFFTLSLSFFWFCFFLIFSFFFDFFKFSFLLLIFFNFFDFFGFFWAVGKFWREATALCLWVSVWCKDSSGLVGFDYDGLHFFTSSRPPRKSNEKSMNSCEKSMKDSVSLILQNLLWHFGGEGERKWKKVSHHNQIQRVLRNP